MDFIGKVAVVTGGGSGIGAAICARFAADGADVAVLDLSATAAQRTVDAIGGGVAVEADVSDSAAVDLAIERVTSELGPPEILVNNAGAVALDHVQRVSPLLDRQREEAANGGVHTGVERIAELPAAKCDLCWSC